MQVLDIGCGWGGMALEIAKQTGANVKGITLSHNQFATASKRAQEEGLSTAAVEKDDGNLFTRNIGRGIDTIQQAYGSAVEGIGESTGLDFLKNYGASVVENNRKELEAKLKEQAYIEIKEF